MKVMRRILVVLIVVAAGAGYYYWSSRPVPLVLTGIVTTNDVIVGPQIGGKIEQLLVTEGDTVTRDQMLAVIAPAELEAESAYATQSAAGAGSQVQEAQAALRYQETQTIEQIRQAESNLASTEAQQAAATADLENAHLTFDRVENLAKQGVASAKERDEARTSYQSAVAKVDGLKKEADARRAAVALARSNAEQNSIRRSQVQANQQLQAAATAQQKKADVRLGYTEVKAPIDGMVDVRSARVGEIVNPGQPIVTLINPDDLWVRADIEESYIDRVRNGDHLTVRLPSGAELDGVVFYRGADAAFATQRDVSRTKRDIKTFEIRIRCDNKDRRLAVGMTAYVLLPPM
jgi:multidrug resistance efflux pump